MRAIVFDMDGLMIDTEKMYWAVTRQIAREFGKEVSDQTLGRMMGRSPMKSVEILLHETGLPVAPPRLLEERESRVKRVLEKGVDPMPDCSRGWHNSRDATSSALQPARRCILST